MTERPPANISDRQIIRLRHEAGKRGDVEFVLLCDWALAGREDARALVARWGMS